MPTLSPPTSLIGHQEALFWSCPPAERIPKRPYFPLPLSILAGTNLIMLLLLLFFFATPVWFPRKSIPHSISGKIHPRLISEKIQAKTPRKTKKMDFLLLPAFSGSVLGSLCYCAIGFKFHEPWIKTEKWEKSRRGERLCWRWKREEKKNTGNRLFFLV